MPHHENEYGYSEGGTFLLGFAVGLLGGAATALLYAPKEGREIRHLLADRAREGRQRAAAVAERGRGMLIEGRHAIDQGRDVIAGAIQEGREAYRRTKTGETF